MKHGSIIASATCGHSEERRSSRTPLLPVLRDFGIIQRELGVADAMIKATLSTMSKSGTGYDPVIAHLEFISILSQ